MKMGMKAAAWNLVSTVGLAVSLTLAGDLALSSGAQGAELDPIRSSVQEIIKKGKQGCQSDLETYCSNVAPGEGRLAYCLIAHADKRSASCEGALAEARKEAEALINTVDQVTEACLHDIAALCSGTEPGEGRIAQCLADQKTALSKPCSKVLDVVGTVIFPAGNQSVAGSTPPASAPVETATPAAAPAGSGTPVLAALNTKIQEIIDKGKVGCQSDLETYCSNVVPGEGRLAYCLIAHADKRSASCEGALAEARKEAEALINTVDQATEACLPDIAALCSGTEPGEGRIAQCLADQKPSLSQSCSEVIDVVGTVIFQAGNQVAAQSAPSAPVPPAEITTGAINQLPSVADAEAAAPKCQTVEASVTDWGKDATARDARKLLKASVSSFTARTRIKEYTAGGDSVSCASNVNLFFAGNYSCRARTKVCWSMADQQAAPLSSVPKAAQ